MKANFHMKRWAPGLALKKRPTVIQFTLNQLTVKAGLSGPTCSQYVYCNMLAQSTGRTKPVVTGLSGPTCSQYVYNAICLAQSTGRTQMASSPNFSERPRSRWNTWAARDSKDVRCDHWSNFPGIACPQSLLQHVYFLPARFSLRRLAVQMELRDPACHINFFAKCPIIW